MKLTTLAATFFILGFLVGCSSEPEDSSAVSTRCEDAAPYLAVASGQADEYAVSLATVTGIILSAVPGEEREVAAVVGEHLTFTVDLLEEPEPPKGFESFHSELIGRGRDLTGALQLMSEGRSEEAGTALLRLSGFPEPESLSDHIPEWIWECEN